MITKTYLTFFKEQRLSSLLCNQTPRTQKEKNKIAHEAGLYTSKQSDSFLGLGLGEATDLAHLAGKSILFVNFRPSIEQIEGGHLPLCARCFSTIKNIDVMIVKGREKESWRLNEKFEFQTKKNLTSKYDYIVARSSSLRVLSKSVIGSLQILRSGLITNVNPMSHPDNYKIANRFFSERDLAPPPSNLRVRWLNKKLGETKKRKFLFVPGTLWPVKSQLLFVENLDPTLVKEYTLIFAGVESDEAYKGKIAMCLKQKKIRHVFLGEVPSEVHDILAGLSMVTIISMDARNFRQFEGYPRTLGECIAARSICLVNSFVTPPPWGQSAVISCEFSDAGQLNVNLKKAIRLAQTFNWRSLSENLASDLWYANYGINVLKKATEPISLIKG